MSQTQPPLLYTSKKDVYQQIRNYLAGRMLGATRDEVLLEEIIKLLFCQFAMDGNGTTITSDDPVEIAKIYRQTLKKLRQQLPEVMGQYEEFILDPVSITYVHKQLAYLGDELFTGDPFGDAYEAFIGNNARGQEGQFFTPQNAVELLVSIVDPQPGDKVIDPACGSGTFLYNAARHMSKVGGSIEEATETVFGIDKDRYLSNLAGARIALLSLKSPHIYCADSLAWEPENGQNFLDDDQMGVFDVVLTNPPFGSKIVSTSDDIRRNFDLGYKWRLDKKSGISHKTDNLRTSVPPQVLFIERCLKLLKPGGRLGMVVPESLVSSKNYRHVMQYLLEHAGLKAVIGMPESLFKTSGKGGTHTKTCLLYLVKNSETPTDKSNIFMAEAKWCGRDSRGRNIGPDELPDIEEKYHAFQDGNLKGYSHLGYFTKYKDITDYILAPRYYNPEIESELEALQQTHELVTVQELIDEGILSISTGDEVGKLAYGTGNIPFVRTSDISNWEVKLDPKHGVSEEIYHSLAGKQDIREHDILMVKDGTYLIGTCAILTKYDVKMVYQSHLYKLRILDKAKLSPFLLLAALSSNPVQRQIKSKRFTQDIIDSLGKRIYELVLPLPKDIAVRERVSQMVEKVIEDRVEARELARLACAEIVGETLS